jgi:hypothetical protein
VIQNHMPEKRGPWRPKTGWTGEVAPAAPAASRLALAGTMRPAALICRPPLAKRQGLLTLVA